MPKASGEINRRLLEEIEYYRAQNENLRLELNDLEDTYSTNKERLKVIKSDYEESEEMIRKLSVLTKGWMNDP